MALFQPVDAIPLQPGSPARRGQIIDATLALAPTQHFIEEHMAQLEKGNIPSDWIEAKYRNNTWCHSH